MRLLDESSVWLGEQIARGACADVYKGIWQGEDCAVKLYKFSDVEAIRSAIREAEVRL